MDYGITKELLDKIRERIKKYPPYPENDPRLNLLDANIDVERARSNDLLKIFLIVEADPYDPEDYGTLER